MMVIINCLYAMLIKLSLQINPKILILKLPEN